MAGVSVKMEVDSIDLAEIQQNIIVNGYGYRQPAKNLALSSTWTMMITYSMPS